MLNVKHANVVKKEYLNHDVQVQAVSQPRASFCLKNPQRSRLQHKFRVHKSPAAQSNLNVYYRAK